MEVEYTKEQLTEAFNAVTAAEYSDAFFVYTWARYAKILAEAFARVDGFVKLAELEDTHD